MSDQTVDAEVDARGLLCPLPILKTKKVLAMLNSGQIVKIHVTDPESPRDFSAFAKQTGHQILAICAQNEGWSILVRRR